MKDTNICKPNTPLQSTLRLEPTMQIVIVTGYSGAGKSTVLRSLEDIGFYCVDNLPITLLNSFFTQTIATQKHITRIALGIDARSVGNISYLIEYIDTLRITWPTQLKIFFLTCQADILVKRFQETRRKHPLANDIDLFQAIKQEITILQPLINRADLLLDTEQLTIHELRKFTQKAFERSGQHHIMVTLMSFGFKYGVPAESNFVYDVRSLPNPYFIPALKNFNGTHPEINDYLFAQPEVQEYWHRLIDFATYSIEKSFQEGRFFVNIAIGCTGGKHRSVAFVHKFSQQSLQHIKFTIKHRDIDRDL